ncbi:uncharacterized protein LOC126833717 isoform X2 [Adelges cooleyi]|uniref:uncharacterized protein LOC126833717 isoform X2 n=1 Tax=Adelges cooleyi TaxID=133065 RepID=UPI00217F6945|nr:uncharacterized protein LOC126833717 isoform X2 [Adelges cooleyi]
MENGSHSSTFKLNIVTHPKRSRGGQGPLTLFSFVAANARDGTQVTEKRLRDVSETLKNNFAKGTALKCKEKNVYPMVHFTEDRDSLMSVLQDQKDLGEYFQLHQGVYREIKSIECEDGDGPFLTTSTSVSYIVSGFKTLDSSLVEVMIESWRDWTGARHMYLHMPYDLGLQRISLLKKVAPDSINAFTYVVLAECLNVNTEEKKMILLDFVQRMRVEKFLPGYLSVYELHKI